MKNAKEMMSLFSLVNGLNSNRTSTTPNKSALVLALLSVLMLGSAVIGQAQQKKTTTYVPPAVPRTSTPAPRPAPPAPRPTQSQSSPPPQRHVDPPPQRQTPPPAPAQRPTSPAPQHQTPSVQQHQAPAAPQRQNSPAQQNQAPAHTAPTAPRPSQPAASSSPSQVQRGSAANQQKTQAAQQKEQVKQQQKQQKEQARQQMEQTKQQQKQQKEQARQQKEEMKRQQKEQARQQKESQKKPRQATSNPAASARSANSAASTATASKPSRSRSTAAPVYKAPENNAVAGKTATGAVTLTKTGSQATLQQVNSARSNLSGINRKPLPSGDVTVHPNGRLTVEAAGGRKYNVRSNGTVASYRDREKAVNFDSRGKVSSLRTASLSVRRAPNGVRTIETRRADNSRVVTTGRHSGFVERNVVVGNRTYIQRTTIVNQRITTNTFVAYNYRGFALTHFVTPVFYAPAFYGWAYYPWVAPVHFGFGWFGASWYVAPNPFFTAYPVYPSAAFWLTDYMLGETLASAYQLHQDALASKAAEEYSADADAMDESDQSDMLQADASTPITQELKDQIAEEVKQQIEYDNFTASSRITKVAMTSCRQCLARPTACSSCRATSM